jgi:uncharacterized protein
VDSLPAASPGSHWLLTTAETVARAHALLEHHRANLAREGIPGELTLTGGSSIEGLITKGDIDLHLRVAPDEFASAIAALPHLFAPARPEIWTPSFATFERASNPPVGVAVTVVDTEHDRRFVASWRRMQSDHRARERYNELKLAGGDVETAKSLFFDALVAGGG